jgi:hypothetical protein
MFVKALFVFFSNLTYYKRLINICNRLLSSISFSNTNFPMHLRLSFSLPYLLRLYAHIYRTIPLIYYLLLHNYNLQMNGKFK